MIKKGSAFRNIGQNDKYSFHCFISLAFSHFRSIVFFFFLLMLIKRRIKLRAFIIFRRHKGLCKVLTGTRVYFTQRSSLEDLKPHLENIVITLFNLLRRTCYAKSGTLVLYMCDCRPLTLRSPARAFKIVQPDWSTPLIELHWLKLGEQNLQTSNVIWPYISFINDKLFILF